MSIGDLFRSKTKHSDPEVRAEAVAEVPEDNLELLAEIARDDDVFSVRRIALEKIADVETLIALSKQAAAPIDAMALERAGTLIARDALSGVDAAAGLAAVASISELGSERTLAEIAVKAPLSSVKKAAVGALADERSLADVVRYSAFEAVALEALSRITNPGALAAIAMSDSRRSIAVAALDRIDNHTSLERIANKAGLKAVRAKARSMIKPTPADPQTIDPDRAAHAERVQLTATMESLVRQHDFRRQAEYQAALDRFNELVTAPGAEADQPLADRFNKAASRYREGLERYQVRAEKRQAAGLAIEEDELDQASAVSPSEPDLKSVAGSDASPSDAPVQNATVEESPTEGGAATEPEASPSNLEDGVVVAEVMAAGTGSHTAANQVADADGGASEEAGAASSADDGSVDTKPAATPPSRDEIRVILEQLAINLESLASSEKIKTINKALARAEKRFAEIGEPPRGMAELLARLERARQALLIRAGELRESLEWQQWANIAKQEQLINRAKKLAVDEKAGKLGEKLRNLQREWKALGPAPRDKAQDLWQSFKAACDEIYERVKKVRKEENDVRKANLALKLALCETAESLVDSTEWVATAAKYKQLQADWKKVGPVPRRQSDKIWKRFRGACDAFFERRKPHLEEQIAEFREAIEEKEAIVAEMEALSTPEAKEKPWQERADRFDDLSYRFKRAGRVPPREFASFRKRQDVAFKALKKERAELRAAAEAEKEAATAAILEAVAKHTAARESGELAGAELATQVMELRKQLREFEGGKAVTAARKQFETEVRTALELTPESFAGTELDPVNSRKRKEKLCKKVEKLVPDEASSNGASEPVDMAAKLRAALADRALGGVLSKRADAQTVKRVVSEARASWARLGPVPGDAGSALEERFRGACKRAQKSVESHR